MTEIEYHLKYKIRIHWGVFAIATFLILVGIALMFAVVNKEVVYYSDAYYDYYMNVPTYPYVGIGIIVETFGWILLIASFFLGEKE